MEWIKVSDRLPELDNNVLIYVDNQRTVFEGYYHGEYENRFNSWDVCCNEHLVIDKVTHWMPLPKSPME
jgi:hypothetical protein